MIGRLFNLHIVKSTPNNQTWKRRGFLIFILTLTSHFTFHIFSSCCVKYSVKMTFWYFITCYKYSIRNFQKRFYQIVIQTHKNNIFVWCVSLFLKYICNGGVGTAREQTQVSLNFSQHHLNGTFLIHFLESIINSNQLQPMICWLPKGSNNEGWLLLGLEVLFYSVSI